MDDWTNYINNLKKTKPEQAKDIDEAEELASIVGAMIEQRQHLELSQRDLAKLCGIPQSSIARIESGDRVSFVGTGNEVRIVNSAVYAMMKLQKQMKNLGKNVGLLSEEDVADWITNSRRKNSHG